MSDLDLAADPAAVDPATVPAADSAIASTLIRAGACQSGTIYWLIDSGFPVEVGEPDFTGDVVLTHAQFGSSMAVPPDFQLSTVPPDDPPEGWDAPTDDPDEDEFELLFQQEAQVQGESAQEVQADGVVQVQVAGVALGATLSAYALDLGADTDPASADTAADVIPDALLLTTNLKGLPPEGIIRLTRNTLIVGPNGGGKTAITEGLRLATTGVTADLQGRAQAKAAHLLWTMAPAGAAALHAQASIPRAEGAWASYRIRAKDPAAGAAGGLHQSEHHAPPIAVAFPLDEAVAELTGSPERAQKWLVKTAQSSLDDGEVLARLPESLRGRYKGLLDPRRPALDNLLAAIPDARTRARDATRLAADAKQTRARLENAPAGAGVGAGSVEQSQTALADAKAKLERLEAKLAALRQEYGALPTPPVAPTDDRVQSLDLVIGALGVAIRRAPAEQAACDCLVCGTADIETATLRDRAARLSERRRSLAPLPLPPDPHAERREALTQGLTRGGVLRGEIAQEIAGHKGALAAHAAATEDRARELRAQQVQAEAEARIWGMIEQECSALVGTLAAEAAEVFVTRVDRHLPRGKRFWLDLDAGLFGFRDEAGTRAGALSGGEWADCLMALGRAAWAGSQDPERPGLAIMVPPDRARDPRALREALAAWTAEPASGIWNLVTSTVRPFRGAPKGWTVWCTECAREALPKCAYCGGKHGLISEGREQDDALLAVLRSAQ